MHYFDTRPQSVADFTPKMTSFSVRFNCSFMPVVTGEVTLTKDWIEEWIHIRAIHKDPHLCHLLDPVASSLSRTLIEIGHKKVGPFLEDDCSICLMELRSNVKTLLCGHQFHVSCIDAWLAKRPTCPFCREV